jgi:hypothetical protein
MTQDFLSWKVYEDRRVRVKKKYAAMISGRRSQKISPLAGIRLLAFR